MRIAAFACLALCACHGSSSPPVSDRCTSDSDCTLDYGHECCSGCGPLEPEGAVTNARYDALDAKRKRDCKGVKCPYLDCAEPPPCIPEYRAACEAGACVAVETKACENGPPKPTWQSVRIETLDNATLRSAIDVTADGDVVFSGDGVVDAPTMASLPVDVRAKIDAWAVAGLSPESPHPGVEWTTRVHLVTTHEQVAEYDDAALPAPERVVADAVGALINSPRSPVPCAAWDGTGDFTLDVLTQDFGVAAGPVLVTHVSSAKSPKADELRAALVAADIGHYTDVYGGAGEGSNLRLVQLTTAAGRCGRAFTNAFPKGLDPVLQLVK